MSYINPIYNSVTRLSGLSGLDVDGLVFSLMQVERARVDKVAQERQLLLWKQEQYREITSALQSFQNEYFNSLKPATDMRNRAIYNAFTVKYDGLDANPYFTAVAGSGARVGEYTIKNIITATAARVGGTAVTGEITGNALTAGGISEISSEENNNKIAVTFNGVKKEITIKDNPADISDLANDLQSKLDAVFGSGKIAVGANSDRLTFSTESTNILLLEAVPGNTGLAAIGFEGANTSNKINLDAKIYDIRNSFKTPLALTGTDGDISFVINGQTFVFNSAETSLREIMDAVNSNAEANVRMSYDSLNDRFILETKQTGKAARITAYDESGGLLESLSITADNVEGRDASIIYNDGETGDQVITRSTNTFTVNGITFNLKKDYEGAVSVSVTTDPEKAVELIKGFIDKYNEILDKITTKLSEKREYDYPPLTDAQKEAMKEEDIKKWEEKAKSGLLAGDNLLRSILSGLRNAVLEIVEGTGMALSSIGIKSSSWVDKGKLYIDEEKLRNALSENPEQVFSLFTRQSDISYNLAASDPSYRAERFRESGLIYRIYDVIQDNIRTTTIADRRGALLEKAGIAGDRSYYNNALYSQISKYDEKIDRMNEELIMKENRYYLQFSRLETLINNMNMQSAWLSQQFMR
ncbi:MAG: flagellar filament capping protein FliD [Bacillota bacterium]